MQLRDKRGVSALRRVFAPLRVQTRVVDTRGGPMLVVMSPSKEYELFPIWAGEGFPRDVLGALSLQPPASLAASQVPVVVSVDMSRGAQRYLEEQGLSWADEQGRAHIVAAPALLVTRAAAAPRAPRDRPGMRWSPSAGAVAELLLTQFAQELKDTPGVLLPPNAVVAGALPVSVAQVSKVLQAFDAQGWTRKSGAERGPGAERQLVDPSALLSSWAAWHAHRKARSIKTHATWQDPETFVRERLAPALPPHSWCLTGWLAADRLAPFTTTVPTVTCYLQPDVFEHELDAIIDRVGLRRVTAGARVTFVEAEPQVLTLARGADLPLASDVRIYADLLVAGARGEDAAHHFREVRLGY